MESVDVAGAGGTRGEQARILAPRQWLIACVWVVLAITLIYQRGEELSLDRLVENRLRHHAIPIAMSALYHGHPHDYTGFRDLAVRFQKSEPIEFLLNWARLYTPQSPPGSDFWAADDRGTADYVIAAFALFGPSAHSLAAFPFVVPRPLRLVPDRLLAAADHDGRPPVCAGRTLREPSVIAALDFTAPSLFEPRVLDLLALVATLHTRICHLVADFTRRWGPRHRTNRRVSVLLHGRSSLGWKPHSRLPSMWPGCGDS